MLFSCLWWGKQEEVRVEDDVGIDGEGRRTCGVDGMDGEIGREGREGSPP